MKIQDIFQKYHKKLDHLDLELLVTHTLDKTREFILIYPEYLIRKTQNAKLETLIKRRLTYEPMAYILGEKEFYGLPFKVNKATLIPRPETEQIVERATHNAKREIKNLTIIDVGTGSGNIIVALAHNLKRKTRNKINFYGIDISQKALQIAKQNARLNKVEKKIKFIKGDMLSPVISNPQSVIGKSEKLIIVANLPYLSKEIYSATMPDVKKFEPKSALYSTEEGLAHYKKLFQQIKKISSVNGHQFTVFIEFSPEQKKSLNILTKKYFLYAKLKFYKDLAHKWRILEINL